jgi:uncharacterized glyoxalase superfamily protein PhnB
MTSLQTITSIVRYRDPGAAAIWLCEAFGFQPDHVAKGVAGEIDYVSLRFGGTIVLVCPVANTVFNDLMVQPEEARGGSTQICYVTVANLDDHRARAQANGAKIAVGPDKDAAGHRFYLCRDFEGHLWSFGTKAYSIGSDSSDTRSGRGRRARNAMAALAALLAAGGWVHYQSNVRGALSESNSLVASQAVAFHTVGRNKSGSAIASQSAFEFDAQEMAEQLNRAQSVNVEFRQALRSAQAELTKVQAVKAELERAIHEAGTAKSAAEQSARIAVAALDLERTGAGQQVQRAKAEMASAIHEASTARSAAEQSAREAVAALDLERTAAEQQQQRAKAEMVKAIYEASMAQSAAEQSAREAIAALNLERTAAAKLLSHVEQLQQTQVVLRLEIGELQAQLSAKRHSTVHSEQKTASLGHALVKQEQANLIEQRPLRETKPILPAASEVSTPQGPEVKVATLEPGPRSQLEGSASMSRAVVVGEAGRQRSRVPTVCTLAAQEMMPGHSNAPSNWGATSLGRLCRGAEGSLEPAKCLEHLMRGQISWGPGSIWHPSVALELCAGTRDAGQTLDCFSTGIAADQAWRVALRQCKAKLPKT